MNARTQSPEYHAQDAAPHLTPAYCYAVQLETGATQFITSRDKPVVITNLPDAMGAADPQTFTPAAVKHGPVEGKDRFEKGATTITVAVAGSDLQRYFLTAAAVKLKAWIIRGQSEDLSVPLEYGKNAMIVQSGILGRFGFRDNTIAAEVVPEPFYTDGKIPRFFFGRQCQHFFGGPQFQGVGCGVNLALHSFETAIAAVDPPGRTITITGQKPGKPATYFNAGHFQNITLGGRMSIAWSEHSGDDTVLHLSTWNPELAVDQEIVAYAGCRQTVEACREFNNAANFGGFPDIPNRTPLNGVA